MLLILVIIFENIQPILCVNFIVKTDPMGYLVFFFDQVKFFSDCRIILETIFSDLKKDFDHILYTFVNICLMKNMSKLVKNSQRDWSVHFLHMLPNFPGQANGDLDTIICRLVQ